MSLRERRVKVRAPRILGEGHRPKIIRDFLKEVTSGLVLASEKMVTSKETLRGALRERIPSSYGVEDRLELERGVHSRAGSCGQNGR